MPGKSSPIRASKGKCFRIRRPLTPSSAGQDFLPSGPPPMRTNTGRRSPPPRGENVELRRVLRFRISGRMSPTVEASSQRSTAGKTDSPYKLDPSLRSSTIGPDDLLFLTTFRGSCQFPHDIPKTGREAVIMSTPSTTPKWVDDQGEKPSVMEKDGLAVRHWSFFSWLCFGQPSHSLLTCDHCHSTPKVMTQIGRAAMSTSPTLTLKRFSGRWTCG